MEITLARRLDQNNANFDEVLSGKLSKTAQQYLKAGVDILEYYATDFDAANDLVELYAQITKEDFESNRNKPKNFRHPATATQMWTLATFLSQILFGGEVSRSVEPRKPDDEAAADAINELLSWNDAQNENYKLGFLWCLASCVFNRGVMYDRWLPKYKVSMEQIEEDDTTSEPGPIMKKDGSGPRLKDDGTPYNGYPKIKRWRKKRTKIGGYNHIDLISPYDFICDPEFPIGKIQESRFCGHRLSIAWSELKRRSELEETDPEYVLPKVVAKLKEQKGSQSAVATPAGSAAIKNTTRSFYERQRRGGASSGTVTGSNEAINQEDGGVIDCWCIYVRARPSQYNIYDDHEPEILEFLVAGEKDILSVNVMPNSHDEFPYTVGEARPNAHYQFSAGWALVGKPVQDQIDYLKRRHNVALSRQGNVYLGNPSYVDLESFNSDDKDGQIIPVTAEGEGKPLDQVLKQIPVSDTTARFPDEMQMWTKIGEDTTGAHASIQGQTQDPSQTLGQFESVQQMATGRVSTIARLLSSGSLNAQTRRFVCNFQDFMPEQMEIRITGTSDDFNPDETPQKFQLIKQSDIQCEFDVTSHDGSMPGVKASKVKALTDAITAYSTNPALSQVFDTTKPGAIDPIKTFYKLLKECGFPIGGLAVTKEQAVKNLQHAQLASGAGIVPGQPQPPDQLPPQPMQGDGPQQPILAPAPAAPQAPMMPVPASS